MMQAACLITCVYGSRFRILVRNRHKILTRLAGLHEIRGDDATSKSHFFFLAMHFFFHNELEQSNEAFRTYAMSD